MSEPFLGMIAIYPYNFAPRGWAFCNGQILPIAQNTALFSLIGTTFGGNGQTTFALPDLRGRFPNSSGQGPGLSPYTLGEASGTESHTQTVNEMAAHNHTFTIGANDGDGDTNAPSATTRLGAATQGNIYNTQAATVQMPAGPTGLSGGSQPMPIMNPYLTLNFCIALEGIFPSRN